MKNLQNYTNKELALQIVKIFFNAIWFSKANSLFRKRWETSEKFRIYFSVTTIVLFLFLLIIFVINPVLTWFTNFVNHVYWGIGA